MYLNIEKKIIKTIENHNLINKGDKVVLGFSGGADSSALFHFLNKFKGIFEIELYTIHINHMLRGGNSDNDSDFVYNITKSKGIECRIIKKDIKEYANKNKLSLEEAGREVRYFEFGKYANDIKADKIITAHHKNDNIETIFININRGSGMKGISGIQYKRDNIIRPFLDIGKSEILDYLAKENIDYKTDKTNNENDYTRNKIRNVIIPYLEREIGSTFINNIDRLSRIILAEDEYLEKITIKTFENEVVIMADNRIAFNKQKLQKIDKAILKRLLRYTIYQIKGSLKDIENVHIDIMLDILFNDETGKKAELPEGMICENIYDTYVVFQGINGYVKNDEYMILKRIINNNIELLNKIRKNKPESWIQYFDNTLIKNDLELRNRKDGDVFHPLGAGGKKKLKDYLIDKKVPRSEREGIKLLVSGLDILWVLGYGISDKYKVKEETKEIVEIIIKS